MRYSLLLNYPEPGDGDFTLSDEALAEGRAAFDSYAKSLDAAGVLISADILQPTTTSTTVSLRSGSLQIQDGPFADTKEKLAGTFVLDVPDLDAALGWAEKCPAAQWGVVEVRPSAIVFADGAWHPVG
ncbi:MAG: YCII-like protein [Glaciihabitans sp.]|jgi:hypothetical protein|nr:YCII-like protein [Glaciihabitans sp.]MDQ1572025.1 hypothetical protein [Actinomycetota bacterium]